MLVDVDVQAERWAYEKDHQLRREMVKLLARYGYRVRKLGITDADKDVEEIRTLSISADRSLTFQQQSLLDEDHQTTEDEADLNRAAETVFTQVTADITGVTVEKPQRGRRKKSVPDSEMTLIEAGPGQVVSEKGEVYQVPPERLAELRAEGRLMTRAEAERISDRIPTPPRRRRGEGVQEAE